MKQPRTKTSLADNGKQGAHRKPGQHKAATPAALTDDFMGEAPAPSSDKGKLRGRPATGKRSNPEWKLYSHFLRKNTQRAAVAKLQTEENIRDLSDVLQELLEDWLKTS
jgi:hypothetical protein